MATWLNAILSWETFWVLALAMAAALAISWVMRGAPVGQAAEEEPDDESPGAAYRDRVVAAAVAGLLLIAGGGYVAATVSIPGSLPLFAAGFGIVLYLSRVNRRYRHASPSLRRVVETSGSALNAVLLGGVLVVANLLAFKYGGAALDFTQESAYTLATMTTNQLRSLDKPVRFTVVFGKSELAAEQRARIVQLLGLYKDFNPPLVTIEQVNPFRERERFEDLLKRAPDLAVVVSQGGGVLVESGEGETREHAVVRNSDLFATEGSADPSRFATSFRGEDALTSALIRLREGKKWRAAFVSGHDEPSLHDMDPRKPGLGLFRSRLESLGARVVAANLLAEDLDRAIELVVLSGPRTPFQPKELDRLKRYLDGGGRLLLTMGPEADEATATGLVPWLKGFDVAVGPGTIWDAKLNFMHAPRSIVALNLGKVEHPVVDALGNQYMIFPDSTPVKPVNPPAEAGLAVTALLKSSPDSWDRTDPSKFQKARGEGEAAGPFDLAVAVALRPATVNGLATPRMVVIGSRDVASNQFGPLNFDLLVNSANWLRGRADQTGEIPAKPYTAISLSADPQLRAKLVLIPTLMAISIIVGFGIATYVARRD